MIITRLKLIRYNFCVFNFDSRKLIIGKYTTKKDLFKMLKVISKNALTCYCNIKW